MPAVQFPPSALGPVQRACGLIRYSVAVAACWVTLAANAQLTTPGTGAIAAGSSQVVALKSNGTVWTWGTYGYGPPQIGTRSIPIAMPSLVDIVSINVGGDHTVALKSDGTVWEWWINYETPGPGGVPVQVSGLSNVIAAAAGGVALKNDGTVWIWGSNEYYGTPSGEPFQVSGLSNVIAVATGGVALKGDGTVWNLWQNDYENGGVVFEPVPVTGLSGVTAVAAGDGYFVALKGDGSVWIWGYADGLLGDSTSETGWWDPTQVDGLSGGTSIATGNGCIVTLKNDGAVWTWGNNASMQLGDGTTVSRTTPGQVSGLSDVIAVAVGGTMVVALKSDGTVRVWGKGERGEWGNGITSVPNIPIQVGLFTDAIAMSGSTHTVVLRSDGTVWGVGNNSIGQLGDGTGVDRIEFAQVAGLVGVTAVSAGGGHTVALKEDGTAWTWGIVGHFEPPGGSEPQYMSATPRQVVGLDNAIAIAAGGGHSLVLKSDGTVWAWGDNWFGALGSGTPGYGEQVSHTAPQQVTGLTDVIAIAAAGDMSVALKEDGTVWAWGGNFLGKLGVGSTNEVVIAPSPMTGLADVFAITASGLGISALTAEGEVWATGILEEEEPPASVAVQLSGLTDITSIVRTVALKSDGTVWSWGIRSHAEPFLVPPAQLGGFAGASKVAAGSFYTLALLADGTIRGLGENEYGVLGIPFRIEPSAIRLTFSTSDTDQDAMADAWEMQYFGDHTHDGGSDSDSDGLTDVQEFFKGSHPLQPDVDGDRLTDFVDLYPNDYYNNETPTLAIVGGNNQTAAPGTFNSLPFDIGVWNAVGTQPLVGAPVVFTVQSGGGLLAETTTGSPAPSASLVLFTDAVGTVQSFYQHAAGTGAASQIKATAGLAQKTLLTTSVDPGADPDRDGLTNAQEALLGTNANHPDTDGDEIPDALELALGYDPLHVQPGISFGADGDDDGLSLAQELLLGTNPLVADDLLAGGDTDGDGLPDRWEIAHGLNSEVGEEAAVLDADADDDDLSLAQEMQARTKPDNPDTDGDGMRDGYEVSHGHNPLVNDGALDPDLDGLSNLEENRRGSDPDDYYNGMEHEILPFIGGEFDLGGENVLAVRVVDKAGIPLVNAPVIFEMSDGDSLITLTPGGPSVGQTAEVRTGPGGIARVYLIAP